MGLLAGGRPRLRIGAALAVALAAGGLAQGTRLAQADGLERGVTVEAAVQGQLVSVRGGATGWTAVLRRVACAQQVCPPLPPAIVVRGHATPERHPAFEARAPGTWVRARVRLRAPPGLRNPGGRDRARALARAGVGAEAALVHPALHAEVAAAGALRTRWARMRHEGAARLAVHGRGGALLAALAFGDPSALEDRDRRALGRLGLSHLLAVSGLHVGLVAGLVWAVVRAPLLRLSARLPRFDARRTALLVALAAAAAYALLAGFGVPVRRALVLLTALVAAFLRGRPVPRGHPLALAALAILSFAPEALFDVGAQLSFAATAALVFAARHPLAAAAENRRARAAVAAASVLRASALAVAATTPLLAWQLGRAAPLGWLANLVAVPLTAAWVLPSALVSALLVLVAPGSGAGELVARAAAFVAGRALAAAEALSLRVSGAEGLAPPTWALAVGALAALVVVRVRATALRVALAMGSAALLAAAPPASVPPMPPRVAFLDVGAGDAVVVQGLRGTLLIDGGRAIPGGVDVGRSVVVPALRALGVSRLDAVVASHADLDHRGGLPAVLEAVPAGGLWLPPGGREDPAFASLVSAAVERGVPIEEPALGDAPRVLGDLRVEVLWPPRTGTEDLGPNDRSLVLRVELGGSRVLLPGDVEAPAEARLLAAGVALEADVLKLPHHGSRTSSTGALLAAVNGSVAVASAPLAGRHGKPHAEVVERARAEGYAIWWTGRDGAVLVGLAPFVHVRGFGH